MMIDVTERKSIEDQLRKCEAHLAAAQRIAHFGIWEFDVRSQQLMWSEEKFRIFGLDPTGPQPTYTQLIEMMHPDDRDSFEQLVYQALTDGTSYEIVFRIKRPNGQLRHIETRGEAILNSAGQVIQLFGIVVDVTERKQLEEEMLKALQRERELSQAKSRFIAMTSHEFRTPLTTIQSSVDLLRRYSDPHLQEKRLEHLNRITSAIEQMNSMVQDVLLLSEAEAGNLQLQPAPVDLVQLCRSLVSELVVADKKQHNITFTPSKVCKVLRSETTSLEPQDTAPMKYCLDEKLVRYILTNLLGNAIKYSPQASDIQLELICHPDKVIFRIQDQGIGIPSKDMPRLFESFHRASNVATTQGTGLGLAIVKQCVDLHGGQISVDSLVGKGSTFTVTLPSIHSIGVHD